MPAVLSTTILLEEPPGANTASLDNRDTLAQDLRAGFGISVDNIVDSIAGGRPIVTSLLTLETTLPAFMEAAFRDTSVTGTENDDYTDVFSRLLAEEDDLVALKYVVFTINDGGTTPAGEYTITIRASVSAVAGGTGIGNYDEQVFVITVIGEDEPEPEPEPGEDEDCFPPAGWEQVCIAAQSANIRSFAGRKARNFGGRWVMIEPGVRPLPYPEE